VANFLSIDSILSMTKHLSLSINRIGMEFAGHVFPPRFAQFSNDVRIRCRDSVLKLVERFDGRENGGGNFNGFPFHCVSLSRLAVKG
jgi:hypothetical protein